MLDTAIIALFVVAQIADVYTTLRFMKHGYSEVNPFIKWAMDTFGKGWIVLKLAVSIGAAYLLFTHGYIIAIAILAVITFGIALWNWKLVK